ncbi:hypothetical protein ACJJIF_08430 [Microbulbifer sp. SSSA002]|uniref:hypothetical protein n=1 Tax=unclassified Microbulbifer TaxID=2619833 RepID=UPI00403A626A
MTSAPPSGRPFCQDAQPLAVTLSNCGANNIPTDSEQVKAYASHEWENRTLSRLLLPEEYCPALRAKQSFLAQYSQLARISVAPGLYPACRVLQARDSHFFGRDMTSPVLPGHAAIETD